MTGVRSDLHQTQLAWKGQTLPAVCSLGASVSSANLPVHLVSRNQADHFWSA